MIREFSVRPVPKNQNARTLFFALLGSAAVAVVASYFLSSYKGIVQLGALILLVAAVTIYTRYVGAFYTYEVATDGEGTPVFVVNQTSGKRRTALCRLDLADIVDIKALTSADYRTYKPEAGIKRYNYMPTLGPTEMHLMKVRSVRESADVFLELSEEYKTLLLSYAAEARSLRVAEAEE